MCAETADYYTFAYENVQFVPVKVAPPRRAWHFASGEFSVSPKHGGSFRMVQKGLELCACTCVSLDV